MVISQFLIERDFHEILHKFQTLDDGAEVASEEDDDQLQMEPQGKDLDEEDNTDAAESRDADVQIENGATDFEESEEKKREVNIPAKYDEIAVVEEFLDDDADEGGQLKNGQTLKQREGGEENPTEETGETVASENKIESTEDVAKMAEDKKKELEKHEGGVIKEVDECQDKNEEEEEREDDDKEKGGKESGIKEEDKGKEDKGKEEEGNEDHLDSQKEAEGASKICHQVLPAVDWHLCFHRHLRRQHPDLNGEVVRWILVGRVKGSVHNHILFEMARLVTARHLQDSSHRRVLQKFIALCKRFELL